MAIQPMTMQEIVAMKRQKKQAVQQPDIEMAASSKDVSQGLMSAGQTLSAPTSGSTGADAASGALGGAAAGSIIAPGYGTAIGAAVGGVAGLLKGQASRKKEKAEIEANAIREASKIQQQGALNQANAMTDMVANIRNTLGV